VAVPRHFKTAGNIKIDFYSIFKYHLTLAWFTTLAIGRCSQGVSSGID
jgi:hypothetical protein